MSPCRLPASGPYTLANARVHRSLTPGLSAQRRRRRLRARRHRRRRRQDRLDRAPRSLHPPHAIDLAGRIVLPCFVDCHTHIDKGHIWPRKAQSGRLLHGRAQRHRRRTAPRAGAPTTSPAAWISRCAPPTRTAPRRCAPISTACRRRRRSPGRCSRRCANAGGAASSCRPPACSASRARATRPGSTALAKRVAAADGVLGAVTYMVPDLEELLDRIFAARHRARARPRFPRRRDRRRLGHLAEEDRRGRALEQFRGKDPRRPLLLAGAPARPRRARHAGQGGAGRALGRVAADVQPLSAGPPA